MNYAALLLLILLFFRNSYGQDNLFFTISGITFNMIFVEGGTFVMGCTLEQGNCETSERPTRKLALSDFFMGEFQVTQELWYAVMGKSVQQQWLAHAIAEREILKKLGGSSTFDIGFFSVEDFNKVIPLNGIGNTYPMYFISYNECELFCHRLNQLLAAQLPEGYKFRIPTEAQWEYAARGGKKSKDYRYSGSDIVDEVAWYNANSDGTTHEVGSKIKNELGIYDMSGNVWEWCRDRFSENYYSSSVFFNPQGPDKGNIYVLRGGSWEQREWACRIATRHKDGPTAIANNYGFRLVLEPPLLLESGFTGFTGNFTASRLASGKNLTFKIHDQIIEMLFVKGGTFEMGCPLENKNCDTIEKPARSVTLSNFYMGKYVVTQKLWHTVMCTTLQQQRDLANSNWKIYGEGGRYPMYYVNYEECERFCEKLNVLLYDQLPEGYSFVLPTEAQWEYAARGGSKSKGNIYSGNNVVSKVAWWEGNSGNTMRKVGLKSKNELGIYDMSGNVWEWCRDWFSGDYYAYGSTTNPQGPLTGTHRVLRGGSWNLPAWHSRVTTRFNYEPQTSSSNLGFRIALEPPEIIREHSSENNRKFKIDNINFEMIYVEGGTFIMGCTSNPKDCFLNEEPAHSVTLSDFYVGKFQVTQQLWSKVMGTTLRQQRLLIDSLLVLYGEGNLYPMYYVNYKDCIEFCKKLNQLLSQQLPEGYKFSLPTEAQWEYAARGGNKSKGYLYSGSNAIGKVAWYEEICYEKTNKVGAKKGNELGIYDMSGNVWEWCLDWFDGDYYSYSPSTNPTGPTYGYQRVLRGGSWRSIDQACRVSCRSASFPNERASNYGFRLALVRENRDLD